MDNLDKANKKHESDEFNNRLKRKDNFNSIKGQKKDEENNRNLNNKIDSNFDKSLLKNALHQMKVEKKKEDDRRDETVAIMLETIETNKAQQKLAKKKAQEELENDKKIEQ